MQDVQPFRSAGVVIQGRFVIEQLLGKGGFSAVYLVRDRQDGGKRYALKELTDHDRQEKNKFAFECKVLKRLDHPALPHVHWVSENADRTYMFMDYVEGPNLEVLRRQQPDMCFPLGQVLTLLAPIVDALTYLHSQELPIIHRDIKPANIIVPTESEKSVLVDFGIAKEYTSDSTTTAVRHCSPGYGAPEQYSIGTDLRTDVYGLAATIYVMLTGVIPVDSLQRATKIAGRSGDPLVPIQKLLPSLPPYVAAAIHRALSINSDNRFASVKEFWQALQPPVVTQRSLKSLFHMHNTGTQNLQRYDERSTGPISVPPHKMFRTSKTEIVLLAFLALAVIVGVVLSIGYYKVSTQTAASVPQQSTLPTIVGNAGSTPTSDVYPNVVGPYSGTVHDLATNETTQMTLTGITQNNSNVTGYFIGLHDAEQFTGVLDTSRHFLFTVKRATSQLPLFFNGVVRQDGNIVGDYCTVDKAGQCVGDYGVWSVKNAQGL
ncbi:MAG: hypothetical protein NVS4B11_32390 [Ktedonobacteraceae bacterium]